jgi:hypothetical protein
VRYECAAIAASATHYAQKNFHNEKESGKKMDRAIRSIFACGLLLTTALAMAQDDRSVPPVCYRVIDSQISCVKNAIDWKTAHHMGGVPGLQQALAGYQRIRSLLPWAVQQDGVLETTNYCQGKMRSNAMDEDQKIIQAMTDQGGDASPCVKARTSLL